MISSRRFAGSTGAVRGGHRRFTLYAGREYGTIFIIIIFFCQLRTKEILGLPASVSTSSWASWVTLVDPKAQLM
jgi:hypothetical protein